MQSIVLNLHRVQRGWYIHQETTQAAFNELSSQLFVIQPPQSTQPLPPSQFNFFYFKYLQFLFVVLLEV